MDFKGQMIFSEKIISKADIEKIVDKMTLDRKIGQMFMGNFCGCTSLDEIKRGIEEFHQGGFQFSLVFERFVRGGNYKPCGVSKNIPLEEVAEFLANVQQSAIDISGIPVIIGTDEEGGLEGYGFRRGNITIMPNQMGLGAEGSLENAYQAAKISAKEARILGANMLYGPSLDVNTNPDNPEIGARSFSDDAAVVSDFGIQFIKAYREENIISTAKHFPGRGHGKSNTHCELETIALGRERLNNVELVPFKKAIEAGVDTIMVAHTCFPALDNNSGLPASISRSIITDLLRDELGFNGLIIPDTMTMFAISKNFEVPRACAMCVEAGADMIFMKVDSLRKDTIDAIKKSVMKRRLTEERINDSVMRILTLKAKHRLFEKPTFSREEVVKIIWCDKHRKAARNAARGAIVLIKNENNILPLDLEVSEKLVVVVPRDSSVILANDPVLSHHMLADSLRKLNVNVLETIVDESPTEDQIFEVIALAQNVRYVIVGIYSSGPSDTQIGLIKGLIDKDKKVIIVSTGAPYIIKKLPAGISAFISIFGISPFTFDAGSEVILGKLKPMGKLPVTVSSSYPKGFGLNVE